MIFDTFTNGFFFVCFVITLFCTIIIIGQATRNYLNNYVRNLRIKKRKERIEIVKQFYKEHKDMDLEDGFIEYAIFGDNIAYPKP